MSFILDFELTFTIGFLKKTWTTFIVVILSSECNDVEGDK